MSDTPKFDVHARVAVIGKPIVGTVKARCWHDDIAGHEYGVRPDCDKSLVLWFTEAELQAHVV